MELMASRLAALKRQVHWESYSITGWTVGQPCWSLFACTRCSAGRASTAYRPYECTLFYGTFSLIFIWATGRSTIPEYCFYPGDMTRPWWYVNKFKTMQIKIVKCISMNYEFINNVWRFFFQATILVFISTSFGGHEAWKFELPGGLTAGIMLEALLYVSALVSNLPVVLWNIYK